MKNFSVVFNSQYGQTRTIANFIKQKLIEAGHDTHAVELVEVSSKSPNPSFNAESDVVIIGAPVYVGNYSKEILNWVRTHRVDLQSKDVAFFSVNLNVADHRKEARLADQELIRKFTTTTDLHPTYIANLAGAIKYRDYGWLKRFVMKRISARAGGPTDTTRNHELTDWSKVDDFVQAILHHDQQSIFSAQVELLNEPFNDLRAGKGNTQNSVNENKGANP